MPLPLPPGYAFRGLFGTLPQLRADPLGFFLRAAREYGPVAALGIRRRHVYLVSDPGGVKRILQDNADHYGRKTRSVEALRETLGAGLLTITGPSWWRNRRLAQPAFHKQRLQGFASIMTSGAVELVQRLSGTARGGGQEGCPPAPATAARDIVPEMSRVTLQVVGRCLFDRDVADEADVLGRAVNEVLHLTIEKLQQVLPPPRVIPTPRNLRFRAALRELDRIVLSLIDERRRAGGDRGDLLSTLLAARDQDTGEGLGDRQVRDEVMTLLLAGHETTAMVLSWTLYLLSLHPGVRRTLEGEVDAVLAGGRPAGLDDLPQLRYTRMVLEEGMRLYPPAWIITRSADAEDEIAGFRIPAGGIVLVSPYVTHRDPAWWQNPEGFDPERFAPESETGAGAAGESGASRPRYAYFPFGGGPHLCIGAAFAMMEATIILATLTVRLRLDLEPGHPVTPEPLVTLRPSPGVTMRASRR